MFQLSIAVSCSRAHSCNVKMSRITRHGEDIAKYGDGLILGPFSGVSVVARDRIPLSGTKPSIGALALALSEIALDQMGSIRPS